MISEEQKLLIKKLYDNYSSQIKTIDERDKDLEDLHDTVLENLILCCRLNAIVEVLDILDLNYKIEDGKIEFDS